MFGRRGKRGQRKKIEAPELELMPMLNVFIAIIPLLLLSAAFVQIAVIPTALPAAAQPPVAPPAAPQLELTIWIHANAYVIRGTDVAEQSFPRTTPRTPERDPGRALLAQTLHEIAVGHPGHRVVRIVADPHTHYDELIDVMDLSRAAGLPESALTDDGRENS
jgi:biopolymer transport protein ExbD